MSVCWAEVGLVFEEVGVGAVGEHVVYGECVVVGVGEVVVYGLAAEPAWGLGGGAFVFVEFF